MAVIGWIVLMRMFSANLMPGLQHSIVIACLNVHGRVDDTRASWQRELMGARRSTDQLQSQHAAQHQYSYQAVNKGEKRFDQWFV
ncbi:hypothetical protein E2K99_20425 [Herbaspirillum huttiense]|nr:hypothetical protein [Herbaspirillum aquaticum]QBP77202.1 hypothetical protein E2K99_20425 [Herbaspirillum huttiense]